MLTCFVFLSRLFPLPRGCSITTMQTRTASLLETIRLRFISNTANLRLIHFSKRFDYIVSLKKTRRVERGRDYSLSHTHGPPRTFMSDCTCHSRHTSSSCICNKDELSGGAWASSRCHYKPSPVPRTGLPLNKIYEVDMPTGTHGLKCI